ncbi:hypothetical protein VTN02DRAFT_3543 [Thermoascus thermophilus]
MTAKFRHPIQRILYVEGQAPPQRLLIASAGPKLYSFDAENGRRLDVWPRDTSAAGEGADGDDQGPPEKKRKLSPSAEQASEEPGSKNRGTIESTPSQAWSNIPLLVHSPTGRHIVAVTGEDKCIRVFEVGKEGSLQQLSERHMPKRPCALSLTTDGNTIICGDKFGDVYSLPLLPTDKPKIPAKSATAKKPFQPAASNLTVHTKRNLAALEQQLKQSATISEKTGPSFELRLLLGHVSMLTDLALVSLPSENGHRDYILTADRDEHIRVSRGPPQSHVIENYCLGHTSFISKICVPQWQPEILISGGGDDFLLVWNWRESRILQKVPLLDQNSESQEVAVRGIWAVPSAASSKVILVATEGSPQLLCYTLEPSGELKSQPSIQLSGNVLDVASLGKTDTIVISVDGVHASGSTKAWRDSIASPQVLLEAVRMTVQQDGLIAWEPISDPVIGNVNQEGTSDIVIPADEKSKLSQEKMLSESLYNVGNLRKRVGAEEE